MGHWDSINSKNSGCSLFNGNSASVPVRTVRALLREHSPHGRNRCYLDLCKMDKAMRKLKSNGGTNKEPNLYCTVSLLKGQYTCNQQHY